MDEVLDTTCNSPTNLGTVELEHPLPEEIRQMDKSDTVCKFCGVSYFIHHEIKQLKEEITQLKRELALRENVEAENVKLKADQASTNRTLKQCQKDLECATESVTNVQSQLKNNASKLSERDAQLECSEKENHKLQEQINIYRRSWDKLKSDLPSVIQSINGIKSSLPQLRHDINVFKSEVEPDLARLKDNLDHLQDTVSKESDQLRRENIDYVRQLASVSEQLNQSKYEVAKLTADNGELQGLDKAYSQLKSMYETSQKHKTEMDQLIAEKNEEIRRKVLEVAQLQQMNSGKDNEMDTIKKQLENSSITMQKSIEWYKDELSAKSNSLKCLEAEMGKLRDEMSERDIISSQKMAESEQTVTEYEKIKEAFIIAKSENEGLRQEREVLIAAHQRRIEELQENFRERLNSGGTDFENKMKEVLQSERQKFEREKQMFIDSLAAGHKIELDIERQKFEELQSNQNKIVESTRTEMIAFAREEARSLQATITNLRRELEVNQSSCDERLESKQREIELLNQRLRTAEEKLNEQNSLDERCKNDSSDRVDQVREKNELLQREKADLENQLQIALGEVKSLQDTVRRECEERFELTEALSEARETLLKNHLQVNPGATGPSQNLQFLNKYSLNNGSARLPELNSASATSEDARRSIAPDHNSSRVISDLPPKGPSNMSSRSLQPSQYSKEPTPPQPESRDGSHRSFPRRSSTQSRSSVVSNNSASSQPADRTLAVYRASKVQNKAKSNGIIASQSERKLNSNGAKNEFKTMLNLAMRRGSSQ